MPHVYADALKLQNKPKIGRGDCVELVRHGPLDSHTGRPAYILVMDQWKLKRNIRERKIYSRGRSKAEGNSYDDSDNADTFYVVE